MGGPDLNLGPNEFRPIGPKSCGRCLSSVAPGSSTATTFRLQVAALDRAGQTVREQLGEPCRILECAAFSEKCCAV